MPVDHAPRGYRALRAGRVSLLGQVYLVTFVTSRRKAWFASGLLANTACRAMQDERLWRTSRLLAWVLMPNHWHGLVELGQGDSLSAVVGRLKANAARAVNRECGRVGKVWADGFHDRALRSDENVVAAARYVVLNPFRAGLVRRIADYPWWGAIWVERGCG